MVGSPAGPNKAKQGQTRLTRAKESLLMSAVSFIYAKGQFREIATASLPLHLNEVGLKRNGCSGVKT